MKPCKFLLLLVLAMPLQAQTSGTSSEIERLLATRPLVNQTLTLDEAVNIALRESPVVRGAAAETEAALGRVNAAKAERRPTLTANIFLSGGSIGNIVAAPPVLMESALMALPRGVFFDQNLTLMAPLYTGGRLNALVRQAQVLKNASAEELEVQRQEVALLARTAYREVQARQSLVEVQKARLRENQEQLRLDRVRAEEGKIPPFFVLRQEAEVAATQQELTNAERDVALSLLQLKTVLGLHPDSIVSIAAVLEYQPSAEFLLHLSEAAAPASINPPSSKLLLGKPIAGPSTAHTPDLAAGPDSAASPSSAPVVENSPTVPLAPAVALTSDSVGSLAALLRAAERNRPELRAAGLRITSAQLEAAVISGSYRLQVNAFAMADVMKMRGQSVGGGTTFGLAASIPIFNGGRRSAAARIAQAERIRLEQERQRIALDIVQSINAAHLNLRAAEQNIGTARTALKAAQEDHRVARIRYEAGRAVLIEVLDALSARVQAESNVVQALFAYNVARDQLLRAVGSAA